MASPYDVRRSAYIQTYMDYTNFLKYRVSQHFLAKLDARKSDDSNRVQFNLCKKFKKVAGGVGEKIHKMALLRMKPKNQTAYNKISKIHRKQDKNH